MKLIPAILVLVFSLPVPAADDSGNKIVVIDGKKFFPLQNARHFHEGSRPQFQPPPKQMVPIRQPHQLMPPATHNNALSHSSASSENPATPISHAAPLPLAQPEGNAAGNNAQANPASDVLSIFAPEEKAAQSLQIKQ